MQVRSGFIVAEWSQVNGAAATLIVGWILGEALVETVCIEEDHSICMIHERQPGGLSSPYLSHCGLDTGHVQPRPSELATIAVTPLKPRRRDNRSVQFGARHRALELCVPVAVDRPIG